MAIRKDLDDMLNNLKGGTSPVRKVQEQNPAKAAPPRKSVYDEMSVDDLLSALTVEKKSEPSVPRVQEKQSAHSERLADVAPELEKKLTEVLMPEKPAEKAAESVSEKPAEETAPSVSETVPEENTVSKKRKKKIVITGELPDYEAIRREEIEKNRIEQEKAEAAAKNAAREANELTPVEAIAAAAAEKQAEAEASQVSDDADAETAVKEEAPVKEKNGGGFFFGRKNKHIETEVSPETETEQETADESLPEAEKTVFFEETTIIKGSEAQEGVSFDDEMAAITEDSETSVADAFSEALSEAAAEDDAVDEQQSDEEKQPSVEELLDAAIAGIESAQAAEAALLESVGEDSVYDENVGESFEEVQIQSDEAEDEAHDAEDVPDEGENVRSGLPAEDKSDDDAPKSEGKAKKLVLRRILDENPDSIINERSEKTEDDEESSQDKSKAKFKKRLYIILGAVFSVLAVIGLVTVIAGGVGLIKRFTSGEEKKDGFTELVYPAVIMDIEAFDSPDELTSNQIITAAIWSIVMSEERVSKYSVSPGTDTIFIPYMDVEARAVEMFGENHPEFNHCTVGPLESRFVYSDGAYNVKLNPITFTYSPEIRSIVKSGNKYTLTVDYIDELPFWMEKSVAKTVEFSLTEKGDASYTIDSMGIIYVKSSNV
ncbi:MAG: hypothetical protein PUB97_10210 [Ruminococcus sp.]|nr:hypothetical protein [Ruminococcus sp.]